MNIFENISLQSAYQSGKKEGVVLIEDYDAWQISDCAKEAIERSLLTVSRINKRNQIKSGPLSKFPAQFKAEFNGAVCLFNPFDENANEKLVSAWKAEMDRLQKEYLRSPEYAERQRINTEEVKAIQKEIDALVNNLPNVLANSDQEYFLNWIKQFTEKADRTGVDYHGEQVIALLEKAGYRDNQYVGDPEVKISSMKKLRWLIGQVINCMKNKMPPHPVASSFADELLMELK